MTEHGRAFEAELNVIVTVVIHHTVGALATVAVGEVGVEPHGLAYTHVGQVGIVPECVHSAHVRR